MLWPLSECFPPQTWTAWTKQGMVISDVTGNNRTVIKAFTVYHWFEILIGWMGHARLHVAQLNSLLKLFLREHDKLLTDSLDHHKYVVATTNIWVLYSLAHTDIFLERNSLTFWRGYNPITVGFVVNNVFILIKQRNGNNVRNTLPIEPEVQ